MTGQWTIQIFALATQQQKHRKTGTVATDLAKMYRFFLLLELQNQQWKQPIMLTILPILPVITLSHLHPPVPEEWVKWRRVKTSVWSKLHHHFEVISTKIYYSFNTTLNIIICGTLFLHTRETTLLCLNKSKWRQWSCSSLTASVMFSTHQVPILCWSHVTKQLFLQNQHVQLQNNCVGQP